MNPPEATVPVGIGDRPLLDIGFMSASLLRHGGRPQAIGVTRRERGGSASAFRYAQNMSAMASA